MAGPATPAFFVVPGDPATPTGGFVYDREVLAACRGLGVDVGTLVWNAAFPFPTEAERRQADRDLESLPDGAVVVVDGLAFGGMPELARVHGTRLRLVALVHHPLALEAGLTEDQAAQLKASEREALAHACQVVATSAHTAGTLQREYGVEAPRVIPPGTRAPRREPGQVGGTDAPSGAPGAADPRAFRLLAVGALVPRKAYDTLLDAVVRARPGEDGLGPLHLDIVGAEDRDPETASGLRRRAPGGRLGSGATVRFWGAVDDRTLAERYLQATIFVSASTHEGYGMAHADALAHGLPVVATRAGAVPDVVPADAGVLVDVGDVAGLAAALRRLGMDPSTRRRLAAAAARAAERLPTWEAAGRAFRRLLLDVGAGSFGDRAPRTPR